MADSGLTVAIVDRQSIARIAGPMFDGRDIALTHQSVRILDEIGAWDRIGADRRSAIRAARVLDGASPYTLDFTPGRAATDVLGYLVSNHVIRSALYDEVRNLENVTFVTDASGQARRIPLHFDLLASGRRPDMNIWVLPGDVIYVP